MGVYISHHDDQYSFEIVLTAMDNLLPILMVGIKWIFTVYVLSHVVKW